jgi:hypothetical protein
MRPIAVLVPSAERDKTPELDLTDATRDVNRDPVLSRRFPEVPNHEEIVSAGD